jgi:hypothetical protein
MRIAYIVAAHRLMASYPDDLRVERSASTWWALTRCDLSILQCSSSRTRRLNATFGRVFLVDEVYIPTLMIASRFA